MQPAAKKSRYRSRKPQYSGSPYDNTASCITTANILRIESTQTASVQADSLLDSAEQAEVAHYKWAVNLSDALYTGDDFTGSMDYSGCVLGKWLYSDLKISDAEIDRLRAEIEPLHRSLHASAGTALELHKDSPTQAQDYYADTIETDLTTLTVATYCLKTTERGTGQ